jgi:hypothetical protein
MLMTEHSVRKAKQSFATFLLAVALRAFNYCDLSKES